MISKVFFLGAVLVAVEATNFFASTGGVSTVTRNQDSDGNYGFSYDIVDPVGATNSRAEVGDAAGNVKGSYSLQDTDGRSRQVDYVADSDGFRAVVKTNEPGTARSEPANVVVDSPYEMPQAPEPVPVEPVVVAEPAPVVVEQVPAQVTDSKFTIIHGPIAAPIALQPFKVHTSKFSVIHPASVHVAPVHVAPVHVAPVHVAPVHVAAPAHLVVGNYPFAHGFGAHHIGYGHGLVGYRRFGYPYGHGLIGYNTIGHKGFAHVH